MTVTPDKQPHESLEDRAARFYTVLQTIRDGSREDAERLLPICQQQVEKHRAIVAELRQLLADEEADLHRWAVTAAELRATIDPDTAPPGAALTGKALGEVAVQVLAASGKAQPIHYRAWLELVELAGYTVGGADPQASFLTALHRHPGIETIGGRTGLWKLAEDTDG